ncbi:MAG: hypothetical protein PHD47_00140 [Acholeplasmataceae bacterium]|nr:hypothetical protein [Acholeplasmataceae bacterium]
MNKANNFKRVLGLLIVLVTTLTLAACGSKAAKIPYGSLDDTAYIKGDGFEITEKELYDEMKVSGTNVLIRMFNEILFKDQLATINANFEDHKQMVADYANKSIFGTNVLEDLQEMDDEVLTKKIDSYVDSMYLAGISITANDIDRENFLNHGDIVLDYYKLDAAKKIYAKEKLELEVVDEESTSYIDKNKDIQTYFTANVQKRYELSSINIRFTNSYEANQTLKQFALKQYRSQWFGIQDPRVEIVDGYALEVMTDLGFTNDGALNDVDYQKYYDAYQVNPDRIPTEHADSALSMDEVLVKFLEIYNYVYPYRTQIDVNAYQTVQSVLDDETLVNTDEENLGVFTRTYEDFPSSQSTLRTYIYDTLSVKENGTRFTAAPRSYGNYYYIVFKLADHNEDLLAQLDEDDKLIVWADEAKTTLTEHAQTYYDKLVESKLTDSYINNKASTKLTDSDIKIYDEDLHLYLSMSYSNIELPKKIGNDLLATVDGTEIKVDDFYSKLETQLGVSVALDLALREALLNSDYFDEITDAQMKEYRSNIETMIQQFGQDQFASSGFPASMGRKNFLRLAFRANSIDEAIENVYVSAEVEKLFLSDYEAHFGTEIYDKFATVANRLMDQFFSISSSHLLIYVDMDEDDNHDVPSEFFETLSQAKVLEYETLITELMQLIHDEVSKYPSFSTGFSTIVKEYNDSAKFIPAGSIPGSTPEHKWARFKAAGLQIMYESLGATTNQTNYPGQQSSLDKKFFEREAELYTTLKEDYYDVDNKFPSQKLDSKPVTYDDVLETSFGWHLILATGGQVAKSAKFTFEDDNYAKTGDEKKIYENIAIEAKDGTKTYYNAYSETDHISSNQIRIYLNEFKTEFGVTSLPTAVKDAINAYFTPVKTNYENNYTKLHILSNYLKDANVTYSNPLNEARVTQLLVINENQFLSYDRTNNLFMDVYGDWFTIFD